MTGIEIAALAGAFAASAVITWWRDRQRAAKVDADAEALAFKVEREAEAVKAASKEDADRIAVALKIEADRIAEVAKAEADKIAEALKTDTGACGVLKQEVADLRRFIADADPANEAKAADARRAQAVSDEAREIAKCVAEVRKNGGAKYS